MRPCIAVSAINYLQILLHSYQAPSKRKATAMSSGASSPVPAAGADETGTKATKKSKK
jgi:hypothetical protein